MGAAVSANPYVGRTRAANSWHKQLAFPSEAYVPDHCELPWWDVHGRKAAALGRKESFGLRVSSKGCDCSGNRATGTPEQRARAWVASAILSKPNTLTASQVNAIIDQATVIMSG